MFKENYSFNLQKKEKEIVSNIKALSCFKEASKKIGSNPSFWIYLIIIFIHVILFLSIFFCGKKAIENMFKTKKENMIKLKEDNLINNNIFNNDIYKNINNINSKNSLSENKIEERLNININKSKSIKK